MRALSNLFIILSAIISLLFGLKYFSEAAIVLVAFPLYLIGHYVKHNFTYRNFKISTRSKSFYLNNLQSLMQGSIDDINEMIRFWINLPSRLMKYGQ